MSTPPLAASGMAPGPFAGPQAQQAAREVNTASLCRIGQETVQDIVYRTMEIFQLLRNMQVGRRAAPTPGPTPGPVWRERGASARKRAAGLMVTWGPSASTRLPWTVWSLPHLYSDALPDKVSVPKMWRWCFPDRISERMSRVFYIRPGSLGSRRTLVSFKVEVGFTPQLSLGYFNLIFSHRIFCDDSRSWIQILLTIFAKQLYFGITDSQYNAFIQSFDTCVLVKPTSITPQFPLWRSDHILVPLLNLYFRLSIHRQSPFCFLAS